MPLAPNPTLSAAPEPEMEYSIVWGTAANGDAAESLLLEWRFQELKVLGKRLGQIVAAGGGIYRWKQTSGKGEGMRNCDEAWNPGPEPNRRNRFAVEVKGAKVERLDATGEVEVVGIATVEDVASFSNTVTLEASTGPYLFYSESEDSTYCTAAHNTSTYYANVYDLEKRARLEFPTKTDEQLLLLEARQLPKADQDRCGEAVKAAGSGGPLSTDGLSLESVVPRWTKNHGLLFELGLATMSSYWMGKHGCTVWVSHVPPTLEPLSIPMAFAALSKKLPGFTVGGWSTLRSTDGGALAAARRLFRNR
ncbi:MAG TPA: hypothetical protein VHM25_18865 [Polyangiaceae bacterium]|nr:hypothetical protein [Polyangiaceae bacterium]